MFYFMGKEEAFRLYVCFCGIRFFICPRLIYPRTGKLFSGQNQQNRIVIVDVTVTEADCGQAGAGVSEQADRR